MIGATDEGAQRKLSEYEGKVVSSVVRAMQEVLRDIHAHIVRDKLSGQVLHRRTGDLSRSIQWRVEQSGDNVRGFVGASTPYAARQEYGFQGVESVRAYVRRSKAQMMGAKFNALGIETRPSKAKAKSSGEVTVRAHSRRVNYPAHSYLRSAVEDYRAQVIERLQSSVKQVLT